MSSLPEAQIFQRASHKGLFSEYPSYRLVIIGLGAPIGSDDGVIQRENDDWRPTVTCRSRRSEMATASGSIPN